MRCVIDPCHLTNRTNTTSLGIVLRYPQLSHRNYTSHAPFTLFPSPFPREIYQECLDLQPIINTLLLKIANDVDFNEDSLSSIAQVDEFTRNLLKINKIIQKEGVTQPLIACICRTDYMLDKQQSDIKLSLRARQVEINAIASGMAGLSTGVHSLHQHILSNYSVNKPSASASYPENQSLDLVAQGLIDAYELYNKPDCYILCIREEVALNFADQLAVEQRVRAKRPDIKTIRRSFKKVSETTKLGPNKQLLIDDTKEVAIVYFRYGYDPSNYDFLTAWDTRLLLERSRAIKCPSINFHLSGLKKYQQILNKPEYLERFLSTRDSERLAKTFCEFWPLDPETTAGQEGFRVGTSTSRKLVLKPQREGGGHNLYGKDVKPFLTEFANTDQLSQYILMGYIDSPKEKNWILLPSDDELSDSIRIEQNDQLVSELGIYGSIVADGLNIQHNRSAGYLVRSKKHGIEEGGVAAGFAGISSLVLIDDELDNLSRYFDIDN